MHVPSFSIYANPAREVEAWKSTVQPKVASTHLPTYNIIGASPRPRCTDDDVSGKRVLGGKKSSPTTSSSMLSGKANVVARGTAPVTRENLSKISMACAREEDLDAPYPLSSASQESRNRSRDRTRTRTMTRTRSDTSSENCETGSDLPSICEEEE